MALRVIFTECSIQPWFDVAQILAAEHGWEPLYWTAGGFCQHEVLSRFPNIVFHDNYDAVRGICPAACAGLPLATVDEQLLDEFASVESIALRMMDRMDPDDSFTYWQRIRLYNNHLRYWIAVLDHYRPDLVVFPSSPHLVYDYVLYSLCKRRGVNTVLLKETHAGGLIYVQHEFDKAPAHVLARYDALRSSSANAEPALGERSERYLAKLLSSYEQARPHYMDAFLTDPSKTSPAEAPPTAGSSPVWGKLRHWRKYPQYAARLLETIKLAWQFFKMGLRKNPTALQQVFDSTCYLYDHVDYPHNFIHDPVPPTYLVRQGEKPEDKSAMAGVEYRLYRALATRKKNYLDDYYKKLARPVDWSRPYVFVGLSYQCENSTSPEGGRYVDQTLMVRLLSDLLPPGWHLYVKEHPVQFHSSASGESARAQQFYDDIATLPNVSFVPLNTSPFDLIDRARAVATVNGTTGWEAIVRGKPTLLFGHAWFKGCEGVFYTPTKEACQEALAQIAQGCKPDLRAVKLFVRAVELAGFHGATYPSFLPRFGISHEENVQNVAKALAAAANQIRTGCQPLQREAA